MHFFVASRSVVVRFSNERTLGKTFDDNAPPVAPKVFDKKCEKSNKLSFSFKIDNKNSVLKKRLADMNNAVTKSSIIKKPKKNKLEKRMKLCPNHFYH